MCNALNHSWSCTCGFGGFHYGSRPTNLGALQPHSRPIADCIVWKTKCPECSADVYYYQNEHGSRVFFDELGHPWPKHDCTNRNLRKGSSDGWRTYKIFSIEGDILRLQDKGDGRLMVLRVNVEIPRLGLGFVSVRKRASGSYEISFWEPFEEKTVTATCYRQD